MKKFALMFVLFAFTAQAEVVTNGGFGSDGATGESIPLETSVKDAVAVYKALSVKSNGQGDKLIEIKDGSNIECSKPYSGISRVNAGCMFILRESQNVKLKRGVGLSATISFSGKLATLLFNALPADTSGRVGAATKKVANISCVKVVRPGAEATCTIKNTNAISMDIEL